MIHNMQHESHLLTIFLENAGTTTSVVETMAIPTDGNNDSFVTDNYESTQKSAACKLTHLGMCTDLVTLFVNLLQAHTCTWMYM